MLSYCTYSYKIKHSLYTTAMKYKGCEGIGNVLYSKNIHAYRVSDIRAAVYLLEMKYVKLCEVENEVENDNN